MAQPVVSHIPVTGGGAAAAAAVPTSWWARTWNLLGAATSDAWGEVGGLATMARDAIGAGAAAAEPISDYFQEHQYRITILGECRCTPPDPARFEGAKAKIAALSTTDRLYPLQDILGVRKVVAPLAPPAPPTRTAPKKELIDKEKELVDRISQTLTRIVSLSVTNNIIGTDALSFEQLKAIAASDSPYMTYLSTLSWWRKAIAFLVLYIFVIPTISLVLEGSSRRAGAIENIKNFLVAASRTPAIWHRQVTSLFSHFEETVFELREISLNFAACGKGKTFADFRRDELQQRILEHGYNHEKILHKCVEWIIQVADVHSSIPLLGPLIDKIITSSLRSTLIREDIIKKTLSFITSSSGETHQNPIIYQLLESIASLLSDAHTRVKENRPPKPTSIDAIHEIDFTEEELADQKRAMSRISDLPYANAKSGEQVQEITLARTNKTDDTSHPRWSAVLSSIEVVAQDGAALLLHLFEDPSSYTEMRINLLEKLRGLITNALEGTTPKAFDDVYRRVSDQAMAVIKTAVGQKFDEKYIEATAKNPFEYAKQLVDALKREITNVMDGLDLAAKEAFRIEAENHKESFAKVLSHIIHGLAVLNNRMTTILERAPKLAPFDDSFGKDLADIILKTASHLETAFLVAEDAIKNLQTFEETLSLDKMLCEVKELPAANRGVLRELTGKETYELFNKAVHVLKIGDEHRETVAAAIGTIVERQTQLATISDQHHLLTNALEKLRYCQRCEQEVARFGDQATWTALWALQEAPVEQVMAALGTFPDIPESDKVRLAPDTETRRNALYIFIESLRRRRSAAEATLNRELGYLKVRLTHCGYLENHSLEITHGILTLRSEDAKRQMTEHEAAIKAARTELCSTFANFYRVSAQRLTTYREDFSVKTSTLGKVATEAKSSISTLTCPKLDLNIEVTSVPTIPLISRFLLPSRARLYEEVIPLAERQVSQGKEFIHRPEVLKQLFQRFLISWFS